MLQSDSKYTLQGLFGFPKVHPELDERKCGCILDPYFDTPEIKLSFEG